MLIDIIFVVILILAIFKGYSRGLILGFFSLVSVIIGLAAAMKLSTVMAHYIGKNLKVSEQWLPLISFAVVFLIVVLLIRLGAKTIEKTIEIAMLGWLNRLGGIIFFIAVYTIIFSVLLFYAVQMKLIPETTIQQSLTWSFIQPWGPKAINGLGSVIPVFKNMFEEVQQFFADIAGKM